MTLGRQGQIQRVRPVARRRGGARRLGTEGAGRIVEHNREVRRNAAMSGGHGEHQAQPQPISLKSVKSVCPVSFGCGVGWRLFVALVSGGFLVHGADHG